MSFLPPEPPSFSIQSQVLGRSLRHAIGFQIELAKEIPGTLSSEEFRYT